jgi:ABC-type nitrate/sulfonate/bicarbonate transport system substrate-binding protein
VTLRAGGGSRRIAGFLLCVGLLSAAAACSDDEPTPGGPAAASAPARVRVSTVSGALVALPQYVAEARGYYAEHGLDVSLVPTTSGPSAMQALLAGEVDIMLNAPDLVLQANDKGKAIRFIAGNTDRGLHTLIARSKWPVPNKGRYPAAVRDLKGAKIGVTARGAQAENLLRVMLRDAGLDPDNDVTIVATGAVDTSLAALSAGQVDAWVGFEPGTTIVLGQLHEGTALVDLRKGEGPERLVEFPANGYAAERSYIDGHKRIVTSFVEAMEEAHDWLADPDNRDELESLVAANLKVDPALIPQMLDDNLPTFSIAIPKRNMQHAIDLTKEFGLIESAPTYADLVATEFVPER